MTKMVRQKYTSVIPHNNMIDKNENKRPGSNQAPSCFEYHR